MPGILANFEGIFAVLFLLISFVGWIINMINAQNPPPAPNRGPQRRPRAKDRKVQNEIEQFLQEAMGNKNARAEEGEVPADEIEVVETGVPERPAPRRRPRAAAKPTASRQPQPQRTATAEQKAPKPGKGVASRHLAPNETLGGGVMSHVTDHMRERVSRETQTHLPHAVNQTVTQHLGEFTADDRDTRSTVKPVHRSRANIVDPTALIADLRKPDGMRKAVILQEILAKPRGLRK